MTGREDTKLARDLVADTIRQGLDRRQYKVVSTSTTIDAPEAGLCLILVVRQEVRNAPQANQRYLHEFDIWVIHPKQIDADDDLDDALDDTITAVEKVRGLTWTVAARGTYQDQPAYKISAIVKTTRAKE